MREDSEERGTGGQKEGGQRERGRGAVSQEELGKREEEEDGFELQGWNSGIRTLLYSRLPF